MAKRWEGWNTSLQEVVEYSSFGDFERERHLWLAHGWKVAQTSDVPQRAGIGRFATLGLGALVLKPKLHVLVVYERTPAASSGRGTTARSGSRSDRARVVLLNTGRNKIPLIKIVREHVSPGLGLAEAKRLIERTPPVVLRAGLSVTEAERLKGYLSSTGALVAVEPED